MENEEQLKQRLNMELDAINFNQLHELGNQAIKLGLILGHGFHGGQYEILCRTEVLMLSPKDAQVYLKELIAGLDNPPHE